MSKLPDPTPCHLCGMESVMDTDGCAWCEGCLHAKGSCCGESEVKSIPGEELHEPSDCGHGNNLADRDGSHSGPDS